MINKKLLFILLPLSVFSMSLTDQNSSKGDESNNNHNRANSPDYNEVFFSEKSMQEVVQRLDITITAEDWAAMWSDLDEQFSSLPPMMGGPEMMEGPRPEMGDGPRSEMMSDGRPEMGEGPRPEMMGGGRPEMMPGGRPEMSEGGHPEMGEGGHPEMMDPLSNMDINPIWAPCTISYQGDDWQAVGIRFKGNSSLMQSYQRGSQKLSMKLDFDRYEDEFPQTKNQRFFGFEQLNLNNNSSDGSFMREKVVSDLLREFGLATAHTAFCEVYIDYGQGSQYLGLYTIVEEVDDTVIKTQFGSASGNLYKPEERAGSFAEGTFNEEEFNRKNKNKSQADYADVGSLYEIINSEERYSNQSKWCKRLESIFDVNTFLKWLAAITAIQNWDSYGNMAHNYFLYNNPSNGKLTWISWDHNEALQSGRNNYEPWTLLNAGESWPLISYIIEVEKYKNKFDGYLRQFIDGPFEPSNISQTYDHYYNLLKESADAEQSGNTFPFNPVSFDASVATLKKHAEARKAAMEGYLD